MFEETQHFRQAWVWILLGFIGLVTLGSMVAMSAWRTPIYWLNLLPLALVMILLYVWRLDTRIDVTGIHYRVFPILPWRTIPWRVVESVSVKEYSRFVGYGIRWSFDGWVYNVAGNKGLYVTFQDKHTIIIGTQKPETLQHFLDKQIQLVK